ncbi:MAG: hypothetical protein ACK2T0_14585 [Anaerolineales bacterium]|jgi:hypothetical protein
MLLRIAFGVGLLALGYFVGREMGRNESLRRELEQEREDGDQAPDSVAHPSASESRGTPTSASGETDGGGGA